jgi:hypothetical protein
MAWWRTKPCLDMLCAAPAGLTHTVACSCPLMPHPWACHQYTVLGGVKGVCAESSPLPPPPSFSCARQEESGDDDARDRVDCSEFECDPSAARRKAHASLGEARPEAGRVARANANIISHLDMQGGGTAAGVAAGSKSKTSSKTGDEGGKKLTTDGDLKQLLAARLRRLRDAEEVDAGLYFQH